MGSPEDFQHMLRFFSKHKLRPAIDQVFPMNEIAQAATRVAGADQFGKVVLAVTS
jgi:zinc-binding alcohol dehydrogenase/oxidoreductase